MFISVLENSFLVYRVAALGRAGATAGFAASKRNVDVLVSP
jgi:hypothetical protein